MLGVRVCECVCVFGMYEHVSKGMFICESVSVCVCVCVCVFGVGVCVVLHGWWEQQMAGVWLKRCNQWKTVGCCGKYLYSFPWNTSHYCADTHTHTHTQIPHNRPIISVLYQTCPTALTAHLHVYSTTHHPVVPKVLRDFGRKNRTTLNLTTGQIKYGGALTA